MLYIVLVSLKNIYLCLLIATGKLKDGQSLADSWNVPYLECSSKTGESVAEVFHVLIKEIEKDDGLLSENEEGGCIIL